MNPVLRFLPHFCCLLAILFGAFTLNYTYGSGEHHIRWAEKTGFPPPRRELFFAGLAIIVIGSVGLGFLLGRPVPKKDSSR